MSRLKTNENTTGRRPNSSSYAQHRAAQGADHANRTKHKHKWRPCGNPPAVPTGVTLTFQATEARTHLRFTGKVKWNEVTTDTQGHGVRIRAYDTELIATDVSGNAVESEDSTPRIRIRRKEPPQTLGLKAATNPTGTTFRFQTKRDNGFLATDNVKIANCKSPTTYNGTYNIVTIINSTTFEVNGGSSSVANCLNPGKVVDNNDALHVITGELPRPKTWYWKARVRAIDVNDCAGNWSAWTAVGLPWTGSDPKPPTPTYTDPGCITFDTKNKHRHHKLRMLFTFNDMSPWDVPGGDHEDDLKVYDVQIDRSDDGTTWDGRPYHEHRVNATFHNSADADNLATTRTAVFAGAFIRRRYWYRARVRSVDRFSRPGDWSSWTSAALPFDNTVPPAPQNVEITLKGTDRVVLNWTDPTVTIPTRGTSSATNGSPNVTGTSTAYDVEVQSGSLIQFSGASTQYTVKKVTSGTALVLTANFTDTTGGSKTLYLAEDDPDVARYEVQISRAADIDTSTTPDDYNGVYMRDKTQGNRKDFRVKDADAGATFAGRVRSVDAALNRSKWIPAWVTSLTHGAAPAGSANNYSGQGGDATAANQDGDFVTVGSGGGTYVVTWKKVGRMRVKDYYNGRWVNTTGVRLHFLKARATCGDKFAGTGAPTVSALKFNIKRWLSDQSANDNLFQVGGGGGPDDDRLRIDPNTYRDVNGPNTFDITYLDPDEAVTLRCAQVGSGFPGEDAIVQLYMSV